MPTQGLGPSAFQEKKKKRRVASRLVLLLLAAALHLRLTSTGEQGRKTSFFLQSAAWP